MPKVLAYLLKHLKHLRILDVKNLSEGVAAYRYCHQIVNSVHSLLRSIAQLYACLSSSGTGRVETNLQEIERCVASRSKEQRKYFGVEGLHFNI